MSNNRYPRRHAIPPDERTSTHVATMLLGLGFVLGLIVGLLTGCGADPSDAPQSITFVSPTDSIESTTSSITSPPTIATISTVPAVATVIAAAVVERTTTTVPDPCGLEARAKANALPFEWGNKDATTELYAMVATCNGWSQATQDLFRPGIIDDIFVGESAQCPYHRGNQTVGAHCKPITPKGATVGEDAGLFMITAAGWGSGALLCTHGFYCSPQQIVADAWSSMDAGLKLIMLQPVRTNFPWTWDKYSKDPKRWSCGYHPVVCWTWTEQPWVNL